MSTTTPDLVVETISGVAALFCQYPGQHAPQSVYIELDPEEGILRAGYDLELGNAIPGEVWHGLLRQYHVRGESPPKGEAMNGLLEAIAPLAAQVAAGWKAMWDGRNWRGVLDEDARDAEQELEAEVGRISASWRDEDRVASVRADQWIEGPAWAPELSATSSDKELVALAEALEEDALDEGFVVEGVLERLVELREELQEKIEAEDAEAAEAE